MKLQFLGTGASEGVPSVFCDCIVCSKARKNRGRDLRRRSSVLIEDSLLIDMTPDLSASCDACAVDLSNLPYMLVTHEHIDHFYPQEFWNMTPPYSMTERKEPLVLCGNGHVRTCYENAIPEERRQRLPIEFMHVKPFTRYELGDYSVLPLLARHCHEALIYLVSYRGKSVLYGTDSGYFPEKTWDALIGVPIDLVIIDCTNPMKSETPNHMSIEDAITVKRRLYQIGCANADIPYYVTHISHIGGMTHDEIQERLTINGFKVAYDGLTINF